MGDPILVTGSPRSGSSIRRYMPGLYKADKGNPSAGLSQHPGPQRLRESRVRFTLHFPFCPALGLDNEATLVSFTWRLVSFTAGAVVNSGAVLN